MRDGVPPHPSRRRRRTSKPDTARACGLVGGLPWRLLGASLVPCPCAGRGSRARAGQADGEPGAAGHGPGAEAGLLALPRGAEPGALGRTRRGAHAAGAGARRLSACRRGGARLDDTIERRWGPKIKARGLYRDPVRSSRGHFVRASGLRWLSLVVMVPIPWAGRRWALPFLTVLAPSDRWNRERGRRHKTVVDWAELAKVPAAERLECQRRGARPSCKPGAGCRTAG